MRFWVFLFLSVFPFMPLALAQEQIISPAAFKQGFEGVENSTLDYEGLQALSAKEKPIIIDVRSKEAFAKEHLKGAVNVPLTELTEKTLPLVAPDKKTPIVVMCEYSLFPTRMMPLSMQSYPVFKVNGYERVYQLTLWRSEGGRMLGEKERRALRVFEGTDVEAERDVALEKKIIESIPAQDYSCYPENFNLETKNQGDKIFVKGVLNVPSSGYSYSLSSTSLKLIPPETGGDVISPLTIEGEIEKLALKDGRFIIPIESEFSWGPKAINCLYSPTHPSP